MEWRSLGELSRSELRDLTIRMVTRDSRLRLSPEVQAKYARAPDFTTDKDAVTEGVQRRVAREFGFLGNGGNQSRGTVEEGVEVMRAALFVFPGDEAIMQAAHYFKYNIHCPCDIQLGDEVPLELPLFRLDRGAAHGGQVEVEEKWPRLRDVVLHDGPEPTVLVVGSHT